MAAPSSKASLLALLATAWLLSVAPLGCERPEGDDEIASEAVPTISAETAKVERRDLVERLLVRGSVATLPNEDVRLAPQVAGRIVAMRVAEGDSVKAGEVVAEIDSQPLEDERRQSRASLSQA